MAGMKMVIKMPEDHFKTSEMNLINNTKKLNNEKLCLQK